jgi:serine protease Do
MPTETTTTVQKFIRRHRHALMMGSSAAIVVVSLGAFALLPPVAAIRAAANDPVQVAQNTPRTNPRMMEAAAPFSFADLVEHVSPAVVTITSETTTTENDDQEIPAPFRDFFNQFGQGQGGRGAAPQPRKAVSAGSGFIIDKAGYIVTNNHVIDHSSKITVTLPDKRKFTAKLIGTDAATDVALLKIESSASLPIVEFGNDRAVRVGDWVVAVGNPFGLSNSVTAGIVSSLGRDLNRQGGASSSQYNDFIQIDAPINQGNSGGPTFDLHGQVIGMNSMIYSPSGGSVGIGFAIPATIIHDVVGQLKDHGHVNRGYLGVSIQNVTPEVANAMGLKEGAKGALVANVVADGPAAKGGFQQGDIVTAINGQAVEDNTDLTRKVALVASGQSATFNVNRDGKALQLHATIGARPDEDKLASNESGPRPESLGDSPQASAMGLSLAPLTPQARRSRRLDDSATGVVITKVDPSSNAADQGLEAGDVVLKVGSRNVASPADVQSGVAEAKKAGRKSVLLLVARAQGQTGFIAVDIGA